MSRSYSQHIHLYTRVRTISVSLRVCCLEGSNPTHWGRRTRRWTTSCAPGCPAWAKLCSWMWAGGSFTPTEPSTRRTCLTSSTWRRQATAPWRRPSATCCCRYWTRRQRTSARRRFEGRAARLSRDVSHPLLWEAGWDMSLLSGGGMAHSWGWDTPMWVGPGEEWDHIHGRRVLKRGRDLTTDVDTVTAVVTSIARWFTKSDFSE